MYNITGGCTALTVVYLLGKLYVANAGDSRCVWESSFPSHVFSSFPSVEWSKELYHIELLVLLNCRFAQTVVFLTFLCLQGNHH